MAAWYESDATLVVVVGPHEDRTVGDDVLAYALAWQGDRDLALVLPESHLGVLPARLAWIDTPVRIFRYGEDLVPDPSSYLPGSR